MDNRGVMDPLTEKTYASIAVCLVLFALCVLTPLFITGRAGARDKANEEEGAIIMAGDFSGAAINVPPPWKDLFFTGIKRHTMYTVETGEGEGYLRAESAASASALYRTLDLDLSEYPLLSWRWKIEGTLEKGDARTKAGDDYAARVYVTFAYDTASAGLMDRARYVIATRLFGITPPGSALNYIWANRLGKDSIVPNPYTGREMMIAVESGNALSGKWVGEERNVYEDYKKAFGRRPPRVTGIAVMTDSDNTGDRATGYYGNIVFRKSPSLKH